MIRSNQNKSCQQNGIQGYSSERISRFRPNDRMHTSSHQRTNDWKSSQVAQVTDEWSATSPSNAVKVWPTLWSFWWFTFNSDCNCVKSLTAAWSNSQNAYFRPRNAEKSHSTCNLALNSLLSRQTTALSVSVSLVHLTQLRLFYLKIINRILRLHQSN